MPVSNLPKFGVNYVCVENAYGLILFLNINVHFYFIVRKNNVANLP